jgi:hypothetical protein
VSQLKDILYLALRACTLFNTRYKVYDAEMPVIKMCRLLRRTANIYSSVALVRWSETRIHVHEPQLDYSARQKKQKLEQLFTLVFNSWM